MEHTPLRQSFLRFYLIDYFRDYALYLRCFYNHRINDKTRIYFVTRGFISALDKSFNFPVSTDDPVFLAKTKSSSQYAASLNLWFKIDMLTMYWFVWQFSSLVLNWEWLLLLPPILIIEQGSFCVIMALTAWMWHFMFYRYIPLALNLSLLWIFSIIDIFLCLHHRGSLYRPGLTNQTCIPRKKCLSSVYYTKGIDKWKQSGSLGLADFFVYNMLVLLTLPPFLSLITKMWVAFGSIISVQVGCLLTDWLKFRVKRPSAPGVPLPVITISIYLFILDIIIPNNFNQCIEH